MSTSNSAILPVVIITVGVGWLLSTLGFGQSINWVWTLSLAVGGLLTFASSGIDKVTLVVGSLMLIASVLSVLRQVGYLSLEVEVPVLVIASGSLMLLARLPSIPKPEWVDPEETPVDPGSQD